MYLMDGINIIGSGAPGFTRNTAFTIVRIDDYNQDGKADVLMRRDDGRWVVYLMDGVTILGQGPPDMTRNVLWQPVEE